MSNNDEETFWVREENDEFIARKVSGRNFRFKKRKRKGKSGNKKGSHQRGGFKPFRKSGSGGKANMANENYDPYDQAFWGKGKGKKGKKGQSKFQYPYDGSKGSPSYENSKGKGGHDKGKSKTFAAIAEKSEEHPATQPVAELQEPAYAGWTDQDWDQSWTWNEQGWYSSHKTSSTGQALMAFHDAYEHHEKEAIHGKLIQSNSVSEHNLSATTDHSLLATKLMAPVINPQRNPTCAILLSSLTGWQFQRCVLRGRKVGRGGGCKEAMLQRERNAVVITEERSCLRKVSSIFPHENQQHPADGLKWNLPLLPSLIFGEFVFPSRDRSAPGRHLDVPPGGLRAAGAGHPAAAGERLLGVGALGAGGADPKARGERAGGLRGGFGVQGAGSPEMSLMRNDCEPNIGPKS